MGEMLRGVEPRSWREIGRDFAVEVGAAKGDLDRLQRAYDWFIAMNSPWTVAKLVDDLAQAEAWVARWKRAAVAFKLRADHALNCRARKTGSDEACNCPLMVAMQNLDSELRQDPYEPRGDYYVRREGADDMSIYERSRCDRCGAEANGSPPQGWARSETSDSTGRGYERAEYRHLCSECATSLRKFWNREPTT